MSDFDGIWLPMFIFAFFVVIIVASVNSHNDNKHPNLDPKFGVVQNYDGNYSKVCDGTNLVYSTGGVVVNSEECK